MDGFYVYELVDPASGEAFYVGKGKGRRMYQHAADARAGRITNEEKHERIAAIHALGQEVECRIVRDGLTEDEALQLERQTIAAHGIHNLTNAVPGQLSATRRAQLRARHLVDRLRPIGPWFHAKTPADRVLAGDVIWGLSEIAFEWRGLSHAVRQNRRWRARGGLVRGPSSLESHT